MELQLGKQKRMMYARVFDRTEEETCSVDAVVPDALGDIGAIVVAEGTFCLWNLDFSDKSAQIEGSIAADVVYAEEGGALRSFPVELPVKVRISGETLSPDVRPWLRCTLTALDARAVNSRKVRVTARLSLCLRAYRETELALTDRIEGDGGAVFTRTETLRVQIPVSVEEKTFTVSETHRFLSGQPEADRLLCHTETVLLDDVSAAGSRVILQGRVCAAVTYLPQGQMCPVVETFETAFSQMLDCPADTSPCLLHTTVNLTAAYLNVSAAADGAALEAEYHLVAQTVCLADAEADCVTDAYCNTAELTLERETVAAGRAAAPVGGGYACVRGRLADGRVPAGRCLRHDGGRLRCARPAARGGHGAARILHGKASAPAARAGLRRAAGAAERAAGRAGGDGHGGWVSDPRDGDGADGRTAGVRPPAGHRGDGAGARLPVCLCTVADDRTLGRGRPVDACQALLLERAAHPRNERPHGRCRYG